MDKQRKIRRRRPRGATIRNQRITAKVTAEEKAQIRAGADAVGLAMGAYLVRLGLLAAPKPPGSQTTGPPSEI